MDSLKQVGMMKNKGSLLPLLFLLVPLMVSGSPNIIDEKTEVQCNNGVCSWTQTQGKRFQEYNGEYLYFEEFMDSASISNIIGQNTLSGTQVSLMPVVSLNDEQYNLGDVPSLMGDQISFETFVNNGRDETEFTVNLNVVDGMDRVGYRVVSNEPISYISYNYTPSGVYETEPINSFNPSITPSVDEIPVYWVTDLVIGDLSYSFVDLIEDGYNFTYNRRTDTLWIDLTNHSGNIDIDPIYSFYSDSTDGSLYLRGIPSACISAVDTATTTLRIEDDNILAPLYKTWVAFFMFNTSTIDESANLLASSLKVYAHNYRSTKRYTPTWDVDYYSGKTYLDTLDCSDFFLVSTNEGDSDWAGTTGSKTLFVNLSNINITGYTNYRLRDGWTPPAGKYGRITVRTSEFAGTASDPILQVLYEETVEEEEFIGIENKQVYPVLLLVMMIFVATNQARKRDEKEEKV